MGRNLKRVPLDFKWPMKQIWKGYINPYHGEPCLTCDGSGGSPEAMKFHDEWYAFDDQVWVEYVDKYGRQRRYNDKAHEYHLSQIEVDALIENNRLRDLTKNGHIPSVEEVNEWAKKDGMGHDAINFWICTAVVLKEKGVDQNCPICHGKGVIYPSDEIEQKESEWYDKERFHPPVGKGYQLWEDTSEGSPISPVFSNTNDLAEYCSKNCNVFGRETWTKEQWIASFQDDIIAYETEYGIFI
jgi:hypothetical protein